MIMSNTTTFRPLPLVAGSWAVDPGHTSIGFGIRHLGVSKVRGRFKVFSVNTVVGEDLESSSVDATVALDSIDTGNADRDAHVLAPEVLDVSRRPTLTFRSTSITALAGEGAYEIVGDASIGDVTKPLTLHTEFGGIETNIIDGTRHAGFEATGELHRKDFGIGVDIPGAFIGDVVKIELDVQLIEPQATDPS
jgi:polyisoprenoid-binding protein YceI